MNTLIATAGLEEKIAEERATLLRAGEHIVNGHVRLRRQRELLCEMRLRKSDTRHAERLVQLLRATLDQWERHRVIASERLAYLESQRR